MKYFDKAFLDENMMGPCSAVIIGELTKGLPLKPGMRVLDLGCGRGITSIFLAKEFGVQVFAYDLWIPASENLARFREEGVGDLIVPLHGDALKMPFADGFFDAVITVDSYHYFGNNDSFFPEKVRPLLKKGGIFAAAFPGLHHEVSGVPEKMIPYWSADDLAMGHSAGGWEPKFAPHLEDFRMWEMACHDEAWRIWLDCENPYAVGDRDMMAADGGEYLNTIGFTGVVL